MRNDKIIIGTRSSKLALWQAEYIKGELNKLYPDLVVELKLIKTKGDKILDKALSKIGDKGLFTKELENELLSGGIDLAVHSLKDMQSQLPEGLGLAVVTKRHPCEDVLIAREKGQTLETLPANPVVATGSLRRRAQLLHLRPDARVEDLRGNVNTRLRKFQESDWDAIILARAGVERLGLEEHISSVIPADVMVPAVGQGALGIETANDNTKVNDIIAALNHEDTYNAAICERAFLARLEGGCQTPVAANAVIDNNIIKIEGLVASLDGKIYYRDSASGPVTNSSETGIKLAEKLLSMGAAEIIGECR